MLVAALRQGWVLAPAQNPPLPLPATTGDARAYIQQAIPEEHRDRILCSEVGLQFMRPFRGPLTCVLCHKTTRPDSAANEPVFRSTLWRHVRCKAGHRQGLLEEDREGNGYGGDGTQENEDDNNNDNHAAAPAVVAAATGTPGLCLRCDKDYVLQLVRGTLLCKHAGCRRVVQLRFDVMAEALWDQPGLLAHYAALMQRQMAAGYECAIHADTVAATPHETHALTATCAHERRCCTACVQTMCTAAIRSNRLADLRCPEPDCRAALDRQALRPLLSRALLRLYDKKLALSTASRDYRFRWCRCGHGQIHADGATSPEYHCVACRRRLCFLCEDEGRDTPCEHLVRIDQRAAVNAAEERTRQRAAAVLVAVGLVHNARENTPATQDVITRTTKRCPRRGCRAPIQRAAGCAHMTCRNCGTEFCWACKVIWAVGHFNNSTARSPPNPLHLRICPLGTHRRQTKDSLPNLEAYADGWDVDAGYDTTNDSRLWLPNTQT